MKKIIIEALLGLLLGSCLTSCNIDIDYSANVDVDVKIQVIGQKNKLLDKIPTDQ